MPHALPGPACELCAGPLWCIHNQPLCCTQSWTVPSMQHRRPFRGTHYKHCHTGAALSLILAQPNLGHPRSHHAVLVWQHAAYIACSALIPCAACRMHGTGCSLWCPMQRRARASTLGCCDDPWGCGPDNMDMACGPHVCHLCFTARLLVCMLALNMFKGGNEQFFLVA